MKRSVFANIIFFYSALLLTMFVMPMIVTAHSDVRAESQTWDRLLDFPGRGMSEPARGQKQVRPVPESGDTTRIVPYDKSFPDAAMITRPTSKTRMKPVKA